MSEPLAPSAIIAQVLDIRLDPWQTIVIDKMFDTAREPAGPDINAEAVAKMRADHLAHNGSDIGCGC